MDASRFTGANKQETEHFQALQNLLHPERVIEAANQMRRATAAATNSSSTSSSSANSGSPMSTYIGDDVAELQGPAAQPIVPPFQLPQVGATGVQLLQAMTGQRPQQQQPQLQKGPGKIIPGDLGGTPVTADPVASNGGGHGVSSGGGGAGK